jgi:hypothetical protein
MRSIRGFDDGSKANLRGAGFLREDTALVSLLYIHGFARPPRDVLRTLPIWLSAARSRLPLLRRSLGALRRRRRDAQTSDYAASPVLSQVIRATRWALLFLTTGLGLIIAAGLAPPVKIAFQYAAATIFMSVWAILDDGIWRLNPDWGRGAFKATVKWGLPFFLFSVVLGGALTASSVPAQTSAPARPVTTPTSRIFSGGLIIQVASEKRRSQAQLAAERLQARGYRSGVLLSDDFRADTGPLHAGYYVVFLGPYAETRAGRREAAADLQVVHRSYHDAMLRRVRPI